MLTLNPVLRNMEARCSCAVFIRHCQDSISTTLHLHGTPTLEEWLQGDQVNSLAVRAYFEGCVLHQQHKMRYGSPVCWPQNYQLIFCRTYLWRKRFRRCEQLAGFNYLISFISRICNLIKPSLTVSSHCSNQQSVHYSMVLGWRDELNFRNLSEWIVYLKRILFSFIGPFHSPKFPAETSRINFHTPPSWLTRSVTTYLAVASLFTRVPDHLIYTLLSPPTPSFGMPKKYLMSWLVSFWTSRAPKWDSTKGLGTNVPVFTLTRKWHFDSQGENPVNFRGNFHIL